MAPPLLFHGFVLSPRSSKVPGRVAALLATAAVAALCAGCPGSISPVERKASDCAASDQSGLWLLPFGPIRHEVAGAATARFSVVVARRGANEGEGSPEQGHSVGFRLLKEGQGVSLDAPSAATDPDGIASVELRLADGAEPGIYQVEASLAGSCPQTFTADLARELRQLRALTPTPFDTFTGSRVPITVEATTNHNGKLAGEKVSFEVRLGGTAQTVLTGTDGKGSGSKLEVATSSNGRATAMLATGWSNIPQLEVVASIPGSGEVVVQLRVAPGNASACADDQGCPLGYSCNAVGVGQGLCEPPTQLPGTACMGNDDCPAPLICQKLTGQCLEGTGRTCDPIEGTGCRADEVCVMSECAKVPSACSGNNDCPAAWRCVEGNCTPHGRPPVGGCQVPADCPTAQTCINGECRAKSSCNIQRTQDRLQGSWQLDSELHLREALGGLTKGLLSAAGMLRDLLEGRFEIGGVPGFIQDFIGDYLKKLIQQYVPVWGQQLIITLGNIDDIIDDMHVISTLQMQPVAPDTYRCSEQWVLIEFDYKGRKISTSPSAVPEIGQVTVNNFLATEVCGTLFIDKHHIDNTVGGIAKWAIGAALSMASCAAGGNCHDSYESALTQALSCPMIALQLDNLIQSVWGGAPPLAGVVEQVCELQKVNLIKKINDSLNAMTSSLSVLQLSGTIRVPAQGQDHELVGGRWFGTLGSRSGGGNFNGEFKAFKL